MYQHFNGFFQTRPTLISNGPSRSLREKLLTRRNGRKIQHYQGNRCWQHSCPILKVCSEELSKSLAVLFNRSFSLGRVSVQWKLANISPVQKANERDLVDNYRSISLLSIPGKRQERIVYSAIYSHVSAYLSGWQHGFVEGRSTATQLKNKNPWWLMVIKMMYRSFLQFFGDLWPCSPSGLTAQAL